MRIRIGLIVILGFSVEVLAVAILAVLVAIFGPRQPTAVQAYAEHLGQWVGPTASAVLCFWGARWLGRRVSNWPILHGFLVGATAAAIDFASVIPLGGTFQSLIFVSCAGRLIAGTLGGWVATLHRRS
jgi:hypothetical protein